MRLRRLRTMGAAEILGRSRQEFSKQLERMGLLGSPPFRPSLLLGGPSAADGRAVQGRRDDRGEVARALLDRFQESATVRFFDGAADPHTRVLLENRMPWVRAPVIAAAEDVSKGRFDLLGYQRLFFGDPIDWQRDPIAGRRAPAVHWSRIDPLDPERVGDSKLTWELNRHQWLLTLGQAYRFTGEERYAHTFASYVQAWMQANPSGIGINWTSSLEAALRLISWCWALYLFRGSKALSPNLFVKMLAGIQAHAAHVERHLSYYFSPNTHLTGEALGLFYAGVVFPAFPAADRWRARGTLILSEQIERQVLTDGVYFEQATRYQHYTVEIYLHFLILAARNGLAVPTGMKEQVQRMLDFLLAISRPDGSLPQIGDADGGALLPLVRRRPDDIRDVFSTAAAFFGRADYARAAGGLAPETVWLLGAEGRYAFDRLPAAAPAMPPSCVFTQGGYAVMRSGWAPQAHQLIFDTGPLGCAISGGHGHADLLGIQCAAFGEPYLVDPGTYCYTADARWRDYFRSTAAHSTVMVDGLSQAVPAGPFAWQQRPRAQLRRWISNASFDFADADHDAYRRLADPVLHRRRVLFAKHRCYWVVVDDLQGRAEHQVDLRFQFAPMVVTRGPDEWVRARRTEGRELWLCACATVPLVAKLAQGERDAIAGWVSPDYGRREPAPVLSYAAAAPLPLRIVTLLFPVGGPLIAPAAVTPALADGRIELIFEGGRETLYIDERDITVDRV